MSATVQKLRRLRPGVVVIENHPSPRTHKVYRVLRTWGHGEYLQCEWVGGFSDQPFSRWGGSVALVPKRDRDAVLAMAALSGGYVP